MPPSKFVYRYHFRIADVLERRRARRHFRTATGEWKVEYESEGWWIVVDTPGPGVALSLYLSDEKPTHLKPGGTIDLLLEYTPEPEPGSPQEEPQNA